jgi:hypothetical protein
MKKAGACPGFLFWRGGSPEATKRLNHSTALTMSSTTFLASPNTIMVLSM